MRILWAAALTGLLVGQAAHAQMPNINLIPETISKTQEEKDADEVRDKAYKESLKKIPDAKVTDPWGNVRPDTPKAAAKTAPKPPAKPVAPAAQVAPAKQAKTGTTTN